MSEHLVDSARLRAFDARERPLFAAGLAAASKRKREKVESAFARRAEALELVDEYRRLKATLGLMDFSDQIALAARLERLPIRSSVNSSGRSTRSFSSTNTRTPRSVRRRCFADSSTGRGHPVTAVGDPNQAIYGWRGASVSNILQLRRRLPARRRWRRP